MGGLALRIGKISRYGNDGLGDWLVKVVLGNRF
jgi:hypothetical protein